MTQFSRLLDRLKGLGQSLPLECSNCDAESAQGSCLEKEACQGRMLNGGHLDAISSDLEPTTNHPGGGRVYFARTCPTNSTFGCPALFIFNPSYSDHH